MYENYYSEFDNATLGDVKSRIFEIVDQYPNWELDSVDLDSAGSKNKAVIVRCMNSRNFAIITYVLEFRYDDRRGYQYDNSDWNLESSPDFVIPREYLDSIINVANGIWYDIEDAFYGNTAEY